MNTVYFDFLLVGKSGLFLPLFIAPFRDPLPVRIQRIGTLSFPAFSFPSARIEQCL